MIKTSQYATDIALLSSIGYVAGTYGAWWSLAVIVAACVIVFFVSRHHEANTEQSDGRL